jgi:hypothetical protein
MPIEATVLKADTDPEGWLQFKLLAIFEVRL